MPDMLWLFVCLTTAGAFGAGMAWAHVRLRAPALPEPPDAEPPRKSLPARAPSLNRDDVIEELFSLKPGDIVCHMGSDHCVTQVQRLESSEHLVVRAHVEGALETSLLVSNTPRPVASLCTVATTHGLTSTPADNIEHNGLRYRRLRRVELRERLGSRLAEKPTQVQLYEAADGLTLWVLATASGLEVLEGRAVRTASCMVLRS